MFFFPSFTLLHHHPLFLPLFLLFLLCLESCFLLFFVIVLCGAFKTQKRVCSCCRRKLSAKRMNSIILAIILVCAGGKNHCLFLAFAQPFFSLWRCRKICSFYKPAFPSVSKLNYCLASFCLHCATKRDDPDLAKKKTRQSPF